MAFNPNTIQFLQYKGEKFPLNGADYNKVLDLLKIPKSATVTIVGNTIIVTTRKS